MTDTATAAFTPDMTVADLRQNFRAILATIRPQWIAWAEEVGQPHLWAAWMAGADGDNWGPEQERNVRDCGLWEADLVHFLGWAQRHRERFTTALDPASLHDNMSAAELHELVMPHRDAFLQFTTLSGRSSWGDWIASDPFDDRGHWSTGDAFPIANLDFITYIRNHRDLFGGAMTTTAVPSGDTVAPIGPDTPGWSEFWERVAELAEEDGYTEQYNILAEAFGAALLEEEEVDVEVEIRVESFYITVSRSMTRRQFNDADDDADALGIDQGDVDDAVAEHIRYNNVEWSVTDSNIA